MNSRILQQNIDLFLSVATGARPEIDESARLFDFFSRGNGAERKYVVYKDRQAYLFTDDKLVFADTGLPLRDARLAYRFDGKLVSIQEIPEALQCFGGDSKKSRHRGYSSGSSTNNNNNNNNNNNG